MSLRSLASRSTSRFSTRGLFCGSKRRCVGNESYASQLPNPSSSRCFSVTNAASYPRVRRGVQRAPSTQVWPVFEEEEIEVASEQAPRRDTIPEKPVAGTSKQSKGTTAAPSPPKKAAKADAAASPGAGSKPAPAAQVQQAEVFSPTKSQGGYRWDVPKPTIEQLNRARIIFTKYPPLFHRSAAEFSKMKETGMPEVAFLGRSNVGKSSLLNALMNQKDLAKTSARPGHTRLMNSFSIGNGRISLIDMPGYGYNSRPEWGREIMEYLRQRNQLRRTFVLIDAAHGIKGTDQMILEMLSQTAISYQIVLSKVDRIRCEEDGEQEQQVVDAEEAGGNVKKKKNIKNRRKQMRETTLYGQYDKIREYMEDLPGVAGFGEILATCVRQKPKQPQKGIDDVRWAILRATGLDAT